MPYEVDLGVDLELWYANEDIDTQMFEWCGVESHSSGAGFGVRDYQFPARNRREAQRLMTAIRKFWIQVTDSDEDPVEYLVTYWVEPYWLFNLRHRFLRR